MWFRFLLAALAIFFAGRYLSDLADETADITGLSKGFIGALILGLITSLPELIGTLTAVLFRANTDLGVGNIFGSNLFNIAILAGAVLVFATRIKPGDWIHGSLFTVHMSICVAAFMVMLIHLLRGPSTGWWENLGSITILGFFTAGMWLYSREKSAASVASTKKGQRSLAVNIILIVILGSVVVAAGILLADSCDDIAKNTHMTATFVGSLFMAMATSFPELVVTIRLLEHGNIRMATGNIFGSNLFNLCIIAFVDLMYRGTIFSNVTGPQTVLLATSILMSGLFLIGATIRALRKTSIRLDNIIILVLYLCIYFWLY